MADERRVSITPAPVTRDPELNDSAKIVAQGIGLFMDRTGRCWPGTDAIAAEIHKSVATVERGIAALKARRHLTVTRRQRDTAILEWCHPLTRQQVTGQDGVLIPHFSGLDPSKNGQKPPLDPSRHVTRARIEREQLTSSLERGEQPGQNDRRNSNRHTAQTELPVQDLGHRQRRADAPTPLRESLTKFLQPPVTTP
jgi:hypothetical protein